VQGQRNQPGWVIILPSKVADPRQGLVALTPPRRGKARHVTSDTVHPFGAACVIPIPAVTWIAVVATIEVLLRQSWADWFRKPTIAAGRANRGYLDVIPDTKTH
jgi:hypothetical protein